MRMLPKLLPLLFVAAACSSQGTPTEERTSFKYRHSADEMWRQVTQEAREKWAIGEADRASLKIVTEWDVRLHAMNTFGRRHRLIITLEGADADGYTVVAAQETEKNTNQENPLVAAEAEWKPMPSDGALAGRFLFNLHRRLNPPKNWQETDR